MCTPGGMKIIYDPRADTLTLILKEAQVEESHEAKSGIILDYDAAGDLVSVEVLDSRVPGSGVNWGPFQE